MRQGLGPCRSLPRVLDVHVMGGIGVVQLSGEIDHRETRQRFIDRGVWVRTWTDCIYLTPALNIAPDDLAALTQAVCATVKIL